MPLGIEGYEPFPIEEEEEPEREPSRFDVMKIGFWLLGLAAAGAIGSFFLNYFRSR